MDDYVESMINDLQTKISNSDMALNPYGNNIFEKVTSKVWVKRHLRVPYFSIKRDVYSKYIKWLRCCQLGLNNLITMIVKRWLD